MVAYDESADVFVDFLRWRDAVCDTVIELDCARPRGAAFKGRIVSHEFHTSAMINVKASAHTVQRDRTRIARSSNQFVLISRMNSGHAHILQDGREAVLSSGDLTIYDTTTPYTMTLGDDFDMHVLRIDRSIFSRYIGEVNDFTARAISGSDGMGRVASLLFSEICSQRPALDECNARHMHDVLLGLLGSALGRVGGKLNETVSEARHHLFERALSLVERELANEGLSCDYIARSLGVSHRYLRKIFAERGMSLAETIIDRRLIEAKRQLVSPSAIRRSVTAIAFDCGFKDSTHFSRAFRSRYGTTPRDFRMQAH